MIYACLFVLIRNRVCSNMSEIWNIYCRWYSEFRGDEACLLSLNQGTQDDECRSTQCVSSHNQRDTSMMRLPNLSGLVHKTEDLVECLYVVLIKKNPIDLLFAIFDAIQVL